MQKKGAMVPFDLFYVSIKIMVIEAQTTPIHAKRTDFFSANSSNNTHYTAHARHEVIVGWSTGTSIAERRRMAFFKQQKLIEQRVAEFTVDHVLNTLPSIVEMDEFYSLKLATHGNGHHKSPYTWSQGTVCLDGMHLEPSVVAATTKGIHFNHFDYQGLRTDATLTMMGWAYADAIMCSASLLESNPTMRLCIAPQSNIASFRQNVLRKATTQPDLVVMTADGWMDASHAVWRTNRRKMVATSRSGHLQILSTLANQLVVNVDNADMLDSVSKWLSENNISIVEFYDGLQDDQVCLPRLCQYLRNSWNIYNMCVMENASIIPGMLKHKLLDERRYTTRHVLQIFDMNTTGQAKQDQIGQRIHCENHSAENGDGMAYDSDDGTFRSIQFDNDTSPVLAIVGLRLHGPYNVYHRGRWIYRHHIESESSCDTSSSDGEYVDEHDNAEN